MERGKEQTGGAATLEEAVLATENMTLAQRFAQDRAGNTLSVVVLLSMVSLVIRVGRVMTRPDKKPLPWPQWVVPVLALVGAGVALYMAYVEITQTEAVCGPVGNCNVVQQSPYAYLFGVIPIGVLGVIGYIVMGFTWLMTSYGPVAWRQPGTVIL